MRNRMISLCCLLLFCAVPGGRDSIAQVSQPGIPDMDKAIPMPGTGQKPTEATPPRTDQIIKDVICPNEITVGSVKSLQRWTLPSATARYARVKLEVRSLAGQDYFSAVCFYSAYRGEVSIERIMGRTSELRNCAVQPQQGGKGRVKCE